MKRISKTEIKEMRSQSKKNSIMFAFTLPTVILYTIFFLVTMLIGVYYSFTDWNGISSIADGHNVPVGQVALNWSTQKEYVGTALVGVRSIEHADENCKTFDWKLTEEEMKILDSKIEECAL